MRCTALQRVGFNAALDEAFHSASPPLPAPPERDGGGKRLREEDDVWLGSERERQQGASGSYLKRQKSDGTNTLA